MFGFQKFNFAIGKRKDLLWKAATVSQRRLLSHKSSGLSKSHFSGVSTGPSHSPTAGIDCTPLQSSFFTYSTSIYISAVNVNNWDIIYILSRPLLWFLPAFPL